LLDWSSGAEDQGAWKIFPEYRDTIIQWLRRT